MRRSDREITDRREIAAILSRCRVCRLAMADEAGLYIVPLNFGWTLEGDRLTLYFHSAREGRKLRAIRQHPAVAFEMDGGHQLVEGPVPCAYGYRYESVTGAGRAEILEDPAEKRAALAILTRCVTGKEFSFTDQMARSVAVIRITADWYTAKARRQ